MSETGGLHAPLAIATRAIVAFIAVLGYLAARSVLDPGALTAARFGLGVLFFALLLDLGRSVAGTGRPLRGRLAPHRQRARPQVDEAYDRLRSALARYVDEGELSPRLLEHVHRAARARNLDRSAAQHLEGTLQDAARPAGPTRALLAVRLLAGGVVTLGLGLAVATLAESLGIALVPPVLLVTGTSVATLQWRAQGAGARWTGLVVGLIGVCLFGLGALRFLTASGLAGGLLLTLTLLGLLGTLVATWRTRAPTDPWDVVEAGLQASMTRLRRAFLLALATGVVVLALQPVISAVLGALGGPLDLAFELPAILLATVMAFLAIEGTGTWLTLARGRRRAKRDRRDRRQAVATVLDDLDGGPPPSPEDTP